MRTAKCSENHVSIFFPIYFLRNCLTECRSRWQGVPILIFANKQDLPGAKEPKELEKLLGLHELSFAAIPPQMIKSASTLPVSANINTAASSQPPLPLGKYNLINSSATNKMDGSNKQHHTDASSNSSTPPQTSSSNTDASSASPQKTQSCATSASASSAANSFKGWYIQPACAITGDGLQEGLEALYDMIIKKRKLNKAHKKKR